MATANLVVTSDNLVSGRLGKQAHPVLIKGKRLALPTQEHLANPDKSAIVLFHPLAESITRGESEVLEKYRSLLMLRFNMVAAELMAQLLSIAISQDEHAKLSPDQSEFLSKVKTVDAKTYDLFKKILGAMPADQAARRIVGIFLKKTGSVGGKRHKRVGVVSFPLYQELKREGSDIWGIKCRVKDKESLIALMEFMFPQIEVEGSYNRGSDSDVAPNLDALMQAALAIVLPLNDITSTFENQLGDEEHQGNEYFIDCDWQDTFVNLGVMLKEIRSVPMQAGNEGASGEAPSATPAASTTALPASYPQARVAEPTVVTHAAAAPAAVATPVATGPVDTSGSPAIGNRQGLDNFLAEREATRRHQESMFRGQPAAHHQQHGQQHQHQQGPGPGQIAHTGRGLDFASVMAARPAVAYAAGGPPPYQAPVQQQGSRWSQQASGSYPQQQGWQGGGGYGRSRVV